MSSLIHGFASDMGIREQSIHMSAIRVLAYEEEPKYGQKATFSVQ